MWDIVEERQRRRCRRAAGTRRAHGGCGRARRCSSSAMSRIASSSRLDLTSQAPCARPMLLLGQAPRSDWRGTMKRSYVLSMVCVCLVLALGGVTAGAQKPGDGIKVHGHWTIDVRNPDGALASHNEFENALEPGGASALSGLLGRSSTVNG